MGAGIENSDDCFAGYPPTPIRCRWQSDTDARRARSASIIRLIVDEGRGCVEPPWANHLYQRYFLTDVSGFVGPNSAVICTPAGTIACPLNANRDQRNAPSIRDIAACLESMNEELQSVQYPEDPQEMLVGIDGCVQGQSIPFQAIQFMKGRPEASLESIACKVHPNGKESESLISWQVCDEFGEVPPELLLARCIDSRAGRIMPLVCHDAVLFSSRSESNLRNSTSLVIRNALSKKIDESQPIRFVIIAAHWNDRRSGGSFKNAMANISQRTGATVVLTTRAPRSQLCEVADKFSCVGPEADSVATLLVEDVET